MKKFTIIAAAVLMLVFSSCTMITDLFSLGGIKTAVISDQSGFDLDGGVEYSDLSNDDIDIYLEPWWSGGSPAPVIQLSSWGDSTTFIFDLGPITIDEAAAKSDDELVPDSLAWDEPVEVDHTYFVVIESGKKFYIYAESLDIDEYDNYYNAELTFKYKER